MQEQHELETYSETVDPRNRQSVFEIHAIPDGGWRAWSVVAGSYCAIVSTFGISSAAGPIENYLSSHQLKDYSQSDIGWIFSIWLFTMYIGAVQVGTAFDAYGIRPVLIPGCVGVVASLFILSVCTKYYQFILGFSILGGLSSSMVFNPAYTVIGHWFIERRGVATCIAATGASSGGIFIPPLLNKLFKTIGYGWAVRILAFIVLIFCAISCATMESRGIKRKLNIREAAIDFSSLSSKEFASCVFAIFLTEWGMTVPILFLVSYAQTQGFNVDYGNELVMYLNIASTAGRLLLARFADRLGVYNMIVITSYMAGIFCLVLWLPAGHTKGGLTAFAVLFGFWSGSSISLAPVCVGAISKTDQYGERYGAAYTIASFAALTGFPIAGALATGNYEGLIIFSGVAYICSASAFLLARCWAVGQQLIF